MARKTSERNQRAHNVVLNGDQVELCRDSLHRHRDQLSWAQSELSMLGIDSDSKPGQALRARSNVTLEAEHLMREHGVLNSALCAQSGCRTDIGNLGFEATDYAEDKPELSTTENLIKEAAYLMSAAEKALTNTQWATQEVTKSLTDNDGYVTPSPATPDTADKARILVKSRHGGPASQPDRYVVVRDSDIRDMETAVRHMRWAIRSLRAEQGLPAAKA